MSQMERQELDQFLSFYRTYYGDEIASLAQRYPKEQRSLHVEFDDLYTFDPDLAERYLQHPEDMSRVAEEALRTYDLPVDISLGQAHVRVRGLPRERTIDIRNIRVQDDHIGSMVAVQGIVRKATDVRPKVTEAAFECQRCGTMTYIPQADSGFQEPHECQGCERQGPFRVNHDQSEFIDSQKLRIQESPEGLRGGETPQSIDVNLEDDVCGKVTPGDHVTVAGVLHIEQITSGQEKTNIFDLYMDGVSVVVEDEEFEDMDITDEDKERIYELSNRENIYEDMVGSIAPSIYGYDQEKLAMLLQLFSGVTKHLPDGSRIRGDLHMLLIGDPGTGKSQLLSYIRQIAPRSVYTSGKGSSSAGLCVTGDTIIHTSDGLVPIRDLASEEHPDPVTEETAATAQHELHTYDRNAGRVDRTESSHVWRMPEKACRRIETAHGKELEASVNTPILVCSEKGIGWRKISEVDAGDFVAVPKYGDLDRTTPPIREFFEFTEEKLKPTDESVEFLRQRLCEEFGTLRDAAAALELAEDFIYDSLSNRHLPLDRLGRILDAIDADLADIEVERAMLRHGDGVRIPDAFDADLMYLIGLVFGDGDVMVSRRGKNRGHVRISNADEELLQRAAGIVEETFGKAVEIEYQENRVPCIRLHSATVARFFRNLGVESPKDDIALDPRLTTAAHSDAFLQGLFDADGSVCGRESGGSSVQFSTVCPDLARQVQLMLETYGVRSRTRERDRRGTYGRADGYEIASTSVQTHLAIYGKELDTFAEQIGFCSTAKSDALSATVGDAARRGERLPVGRALVRTDGAGGPFYKNMNWGDNPSRERAREILADRDLGNVAPIVEEAVEADLVWDEVVAAVDSGKKEVFDLTVPDTHNFIGNGIVTHNTAAAVRDDFGDGQQWTLEAGALVLADKGIAAIDELDKMRCVTGDTLVNLDDRTTRIRELARDAAESGDVEELPNGRTIRGIDAEAWTMTHDGRLVTRPVTAVHEYDAPSELTEVTLQSGEMLSATPDHPYFVFEDGERVEKPAEALESGDWVYVPKHLPEPAADGGVTPGQVSDATRKPPIGSATSTGQSGAPGIGPDLAAVLGYLAGDGNLYYNRDVGVYGIRFTNKEEQLLSDFERACSESFGAEPVRPPSEQRADGVGTVRLPGREHADRVIDAGMNRETYDGKTLPEAVTASSRRAKAAFVRALADSEGSVDRQKVTVYSASYDLLLGTKQLLLEFGVSSQIQRRERDDKRDLFVLAITDADSLVAFDRYLGFTLDRKQAALDDVVDSVDGDRTILDVIPEVDELLEDLRSSLRLHQSECGLVDSTYCNFENGDANVSIRLAERVLESFESRKREADEDKSRLDEADWETLAELKEEYHVSQSELATGTSYSQPRVSTGWGVDDELRATVRDRLRTVVETVVDTDLSSLRELVRGDVKWRRVDSIETVPSSAVEDRTRLLEGKLADLIECDETEAVEGAREVLDTEPALDDWRTLKHEIDRYGVSHGTIADDLDVHQTTVTRWLNGTVETDRFADVVDVVQALIDERRTEIAGLLTEIEERQEPKVYDLTVAGTHNFLANGMVVHNSEDRSAMHEGLEQQQISVSKAGINATLKSRCSLLGAANPKYGRFDQYEPIGEQIDLEPALISRFDLIFTVTDQPDPDHDAKLAEHIITTNYAGELNTQREKVTNSEYTAEEVENVTEEVAPVIDAEVLRKYIAYSKRNCYPTMTDEAKEAIRDFYVDLRAKGADEDAPVPVTARKLEALVRLSEASARVRLSDTVDPEDAERVIDIVRSCLQDIGVDPETGQFDADVVETGTSKSQRDRIKNIKELITTIADEYDDEPGAPVEKILERADEVGMDPDKAEQEIESLRRKGEVYEPQNGYIRTT